MKELIDGIVAGNPSSEKALFEILQGHLKISVNLFLERGRLEEDDVLLESITAVFNHIRRDGGFDGDLIRFAITIARNRCRNILNQQKRRPQTAIEPLADWIANKDCSPLDHLMESEASSLLKSAINGLDQACRRLLRGFYFENLNMETLRRRMGLESVQGVYYRRTVCLRNLGNRLMDSQPDLLSG
ncbi:MAG: sigma-70 family RNA polymerase sigma factor [bacterium]|nr:sigma-70 family RNA polymerase sigma factor [bacterium]